MQIANLSDMLQPMLAGIPAMSTALVPAGQKLLSLAITITLLNAIYGWWAGGSSVGLEKAIRGLFLFSIPYTMLNGDHWITFNSALAGFFQNGLVQPLIDSIGGSGAGSSADIVKNMIDQLASALWPATQPQQQSLSVLHPLDALGQFASNIQNFTLMAFVQLVGLLLIVAILVGMYGPLVGMGLCIIVGPVFICWLPLKEMSDKVWRWFDTMLVLGVTLILQVAFILLASKSIHLFATSLVSLSSDPNLSFLEATGAKGKAVLAMLGMMAFIILEFIALPSLAKSLVGASAGSNVAGTVVNNISQNLPSLK